jgi:hypothetical protein
VLLDFFDRRKQKRKRFQNGTRRKKIAEICLYPRKKRRKEQEKKKKYEKESV